MNAPEFGMGGSRQEYRIRRMLRFDMEQHDLLSHEIVHLTRSIERSAWMPNAEEHIFQGVRSDQVERAMDVTSIKKGGCVTNLEVQLYGGLNNSDSVRYTYHPDLGTYWKSINYSHNQRMVTGSDFVSALSLEAQKIELSPLMNMTDVPVDAIDSALMNYAEDSNQTHEAHVVAKRYEYHDLDGVNADMIHRDINGHTNHFVFDVYKKINKDGHNLTFAINYELEIDSVNNEPRGRLTVEVVTKDVLTSAQKENYVSVASEEAYIYLTSVIKRMHDYAETSFEV